MTKNELIRAYAKEVKITQDESRRLLEGLQEFIIETLQSGENITFMDLGKFEVKEVKARKWQLKQEDGTKLEGVKPAHNEVKFRTLGLLKNLEIE